MRARMWRMGARELRAKGLRTRGLRTRIWELEFWGEVLEPGEMAEGTRV